MTKKEIKFYFNKLELFQNLVNFRPGLDKFLFLIIPGSLTVEV